MNARLRRIDADYEEVKKNFTGHKNILIEPIGSDPAEKYRITYYIKGIYVQEDGKVSYIDKHVVNITLHSEYPRFKPICTIETPIWHPNFKDGQICIGDIWGAGESLSDIIVNIGDMIQYKSWNSFSPLSAKAAKWAIENKNILPVGNINLWTGEEENQNIAEDFDIEVLDNESENDEESNDSALIIEADQTNQPNQTVELDEFGKLYEIYEQNKCEKNEDENDFEITTEELEGIEFVPSSAKMQSIQSESLTDKKRINFKTIFFKGILYGLIGGLLGWMINEFLDVNTEKILIWQGHSYVSLQNDLYFGNISEIEAQQLIGVAILLETSAFSAILGSIIGCIMGFGEGIYYGSKRNAFKYGLIGFFVAFIISFIGGGIAQVIYNYALMGADESTSMLFWSAARGISWSAIGLGVGISIGLIKPEKLRIINCVIGGTIGGFIGGFIFNYIGEAIILSAMDTGIVPRAVGIIIMGALIGLGVGVLEQFSKNAWLKVVRGEFEGKEYLVFNGTTSIGNSGKNTISLFKDKLVSPKHCAIVQEGNRYTLMDKGSVSGTLVNGRKITKRVLKQGDTISIGNSVLIFNKK